MSRNISQMPSSSISVTKVTIFLFEAKDLPAMDRNGLSDPFCKFKVGTEKCRSRVIKKTLNPQWNEKFDFFLEDQAPLRILQVSVWDWNGTLQRNEIIGRADIHLATFERGKTSDMWIDLKDKTTRRGSLHLSICVHDKQLINEETSSNILEENAHLLRGDSAKSISEPVVSIQRSLPATDYQSPTEEPIAVHPFRQPVGSLSVNLKKITNLPPSDSDGKSVFLVMQLGFVRFQTHSVPRSQAPEWNCEYQFPVTDVHSILEITVNERDVKGRTNMLGARAIPLLNIENGSTNTWILKDKKLQKNIPACISLELKLEYDMVQAVLRTIKPKDEVQSEISKKITTQIMLRKVSQIRKMVTLFSDLFQLIGCIMRWESPELTIAVYCCFLFTVTFFQPYWIPLILLSLFGFSYLASGSDEIFAPDEDDFDDLSVSDISSTPSTSSRFSAIEGLVSFVPERLRVQTGKIWSKMTGETGSYLVGNFRSAHDQARFVQSILEFLAEHYEKTINTFNFTVPWLSIFAIVALSFTSLAFFILPFRLVLVIWGTYEFSKGFFGSYDFELISFLSRVHTRHEARLYAEKKRNL